jgi:hypothetical protein
VEDFEEADFGWAVSSTIWAVLGILIKGIGAASHRILGFS